MIYEKRRSYRCLAWGVLLALVSQQAVGDRLERELGNYVDRRIVTTSTLLLAPEVSHRMEALLEGLGELQGVRDGPYSVRILNTAAVDSFSTSGNRVYVTTGLLDLLHDEDELVAILARELYHMERDSHDKAVRQMRRRANEKTAAAVIAVVVIVGVVILLVWACHEMDDPSGPSRDPGVKRRPSHRPGGRRSGPPPLYPIVLLSWTASAPPPPPPEQPPPLDWIDTPLRLGYDKEIELEADQYAMETLRKRGGDPAAFLSVLERLQSVYREMGNAAGAYPSSLLQAEPGLPARISAAQTHLQRTEGHTSR